MREKTVEAFLLFFLQNVYFRRFYFNNIDIFRHVTDFFIIFFLVVFFTVLCWTLNNSFSFLFSTISGLFRSFFLKVNLQVKLWFRSLRESACVPCIVCSFWSFNLSAQIVGETSKVATCGKATSIFVFNVTVSGGLILIFLGTFTEKTASLLIIMPCLRFLSLVMVLCEPKIVSVIFVNIYLSFVPQEMKKCILHQQQFDCDELLKQHYIDFCNLNGENYFYYL